MRGPPTSLSLRVEPQCRAPGPHLLLGLFTPLGPIMSRRHLPLYVLLPSLVPLSFFGACGELDCSETLTCTSSDDHAGGGGGAGGAGSPGGAPGGTAGGSPGMGGESSGGLGGTMGIDPEPEPGIPSVVSATVDGRDLVGILAGVSKDAVIVLTFSEEMDPSLTEAAYASLEAPLLPEAVSFAWSNDNKVLTIEPGSPLPYTEVENPNAPGEVLTFSLGEAAKSEAGVALNEEFKASFRMLKRVTQRIYPEDANSSSYAYLSPSTASPYSGLPETSSACLYTGSLAFIGYDSEYYEPGIPGRHSSNGNRVTIIAFPMAEIASDTLESAYFSMVKWERSPSASEGIEDYAFGVDVLPPGTFSTSWANTAALANNIPDKDGLTTSTVYGTYEYPVKTHVEERLSADSPNTVFRLGFDSYPSDGSTICVAGSLEVVYLHP